ncbi:hypothetical protein HJA87_31185 [Rhizobium bangladeshense]|uniref:Uncharacterized protein n=1 Tax=Rhizobium bangladeshense TaxID=1138189 RepID=A0ABS7LS37_9HYPH|nr:hypothetical protein [Rhizobium bangladeshense]MBY3594267.1 hypothetical protein [Rhizobium bangladeshense]
MDQEIIAAVREVERAEAAAKQYFDMLWRIRDHLRIQQTEDDTPIPLARAVCHPILGGILRRDPRADVPGPAFTKASLELAIRKGTLQAVWKNNKLHVTPAALRAWVTLSEKERKQPPLKVAYENLDIKSNREKQQAMTSQNLLQQQLAALKAARKKGRK